MCSFAVGVPPEEVKKKIDIYRDAVRGCTTPIGKYVHDEAATFTMTMCAPTRDEAWSTARESFEWYPVHGARLIASHIAGPATFTVVRGVTGYEAVRG